MRTAHYFKIISKEEDHSQDFYESLTEILEGDNSLIAVNEFSTYEIMYTFLEKEKVLQLKNLFEFHEILIEDQEITEDVIKSTIDNEEFEETFSDSDYLEILENFILMNLTIDDVLDKISEKGYDSLNYVEKKFLNINS
jgi:hypothetical protein